MSPTLGPAAVVALSGLAWLVESVADGIVCRVAVMYERFTEKARRVMQLANLEAQQLNHGYIGTEHILLGLVAEDSGGAARVLKSLHVSLDNIRNEVRKILQSGSETGRVGKLPQTPRAKSVIEYSIEES